MRIVQVTEFGAPEVLVAREAPDPAAGPGQAVLGVAVADVMFIDAQLRSGWGREYFGTEPPYVPGTGAAGTVVSVGEGVDPGWVGRAAAVFTGSGGGYAERIAAPVENLVAVPDGVGLREAAALLQTGPAALKLVDAAGIEPGERVLVTAAGGGLGSLLVQLAGAAGARVVAAAGGEPKRRLARDLGAAAAVDYARADWPEQVRAATDGHGVDVVFDGVGGGVGRDALATAAHGARFFGYGAPSGGFAEIDPDEAGRRGIAVHGIEQVQFAPADMAGLVERTFAAAAAGLIRPVIGRTFPLERAAEAHAAVESRGVVGKTLLLT